MRRSSGGAFPPAHLTSPCTVALAMSEILKCLMAEMRAATFAIVQSWCLNVDLQKLIWVWTIQTIMERKHEAETLGWSSQTLWQGSSVKMKHTFAVFCGKVQVWDHGWLILCNSIGPALTTGAL